jgi:hypothetical protein
VDREDPWHSRTTLNNYIPQCPQTRTPHGSCFGFRWRPCILQWARRACQWWSSLLRKHSSSSDCSWLHYRAQEDRHMLGKIYWLRAAVSYCLWLSESDVEGLLFIAAASWSSSSPVTILTTRIMLFLFVSPGAYWQAGAHPWLYNTAKVDTVFPCSKSLQPDFRRINCQRCFGSDYERISGISDGSSDTHVDKCDFNILESAIYNCVHDHPA